MLDANHGRFQSDANLTSGTIHRGKVHSVSANGFECMGTSNRLRDKCLHDVPRETGVAIGKAMALYLAAPANHPQVPGARERVGSQPPGCRLMRSHEQADKFA